jgi:UDP-glucuronate 4-epimerase
MKILITGVAGFIGFSLAKSLLQDNKNISIYGIDNLDDYYSKKIKKLRIDELKKSKKFKFFKVDICNRVLLKKNLKKKKFSYVIHLAAQAGVRFSEIEPKKYINTNIFGFINLLDTVLESPPIKILYASSSSVYGEPKKLPMSEKDKLGPINIYASSKQLNEIIAKFYSKYHNLNMVGLRFFTVYGEWGRPDMFLFKLFKSFFLKNHFYLNNAGNHKRDFTYIKDVIEVTKKIIFSKKIKSKNLIFNVCSNKPIKITKIIDFFQRKTGKVKISKILRNKLDVKNTHGSNSAIKKITSFNKFTNYKTGIINSYNWYKKYKIYNIK